MMKQSSNGYEIGMFLTGFVFFFIGWIYCISAYGFFIGVIFGWIPALIIAFFAGLLWPLLAVVLFVLVMHYMH
jgi:hypothetical protein